MTFSELLIANGDESPVWHWKLEIVHFHNFEQFTN